jgi:hypothetical protein
MTWRNQMWNKIFLKMIFLIPQIVNERNKLTGYFAHGGTVDTENDYGDRIMMTTIFFPL